MAVFVFCASWIFGFETTKTLRLSADGIDRIKVDCGAGFLFVYGDESLKDIEVSAEIVVRRKREKDMEEYIKENVELELKKQGSKAVLISRFKSARWGIIFTTRVINVEVHMPSNLNLAVHDGSGEMRVEKIKGQVQIDDGSGEIRIRDVQGNISIDDGSGGIEVVEVAGSVFVDDGSGSINVDRVGGDVIIKDDGSGSVNISNVKGKVVK
jgi:DUF4097 and DUF4098 domain-containing protein YvlB